MGIVLTRYDEGTDVVFDESTFDYGYDDSTFPTTVNEDVMTILIENGDVYYITRQDTTEDSMGHVTDIDCSDIRVYGMFQDIGIKDRKIHDMGLAVPGNRKFYFMPDYPITSAGVTMHYQIKEGDIITDTKLFTGEGNTGQYRVVKLLKQWWLPGTEAYRTAIVKSINLDGTE